jgi:glucan phosphorylase
MKAAINAIPSVSILDGWWDEGFQGDNGWAIAAGTTNDGGSQDDADARELYRLLEDEIVPRYFDRDADGLPQAWLATMRAAVQRAIWAFSTARMLSEYVEQLYLPAVAAGSAAPAAAG